MVVVGRAALTDCLAYGVFVRRGGDRRPRLGVRAEFGVLDLHARASLAEPEIAELLAARSLDPLLAAGRPVWAQVHRLVREWVGAGADLIAFDELELRLPFTVADYVDFYASEHHAANLGRLLRPGQPPLQPNWRHQPVGYHGRAGTVVVSGTAVRRPCGHVATPEGPRLQATERLDVEVEVGFVVGVGSRLGDPVPLEAFADHVFGLVVVNDWSARDVQAWESVPLGPFLGKSFMTSVSPWVVPLVELEAARVWPGSHGTQLSPYLVESEPWGLDISLELRVNGELLTRPPYRSVHWSPAQLLAHLTVNGAALRSGDLFASGTVSGVEAAEVGSLYELWQGGRFLADGDEVVISATAPAAGGGRLDLGAVAGTVLPSA